jgi:hypothetical protein
MSVHYDIETATRVTMQEATNIPGTVITLDMLTGVIPHDEDVRKLRDICSSTCLRPREVVEVYRLVKNLQDTRRLCELSTRGFKLSKILQVGEILVTNEKYKDLGPSTSFRRVLWARKDDKGLVSFSEEQYAQALGLKLGCPSVNWDDDTAQLYLDDIVQFVKECM